MLLAPPVAPFTVALGVFAALLLLELLLHLAGGSLLAVETEAGAVADAEVPMPDGSDPAGLPGAGAPGGLAGLLGLGEAPAGVWLAAALVGFGLSGHVLQIAATAVFMAPLPAWIAAAPAAAAGLFFARGYARALARLLPRTETAATSVQFLGGLSGEVTQGTARAGVPAEVRLRDRHGNLHHLRAEPLDPADVIPEGTPVITVRRRAPDLPGGWTLRILPAARPAAPVKDPKS